MSTPTQRVIEGAYKILSDKNRWTKGYMARGPYGMSVPLESPCARKFCLVGALRRSAKQGKGEAGARRILKRLCSGSDMYFNDKKSTTHADILNLLRRAHKEAGNGELVEVYL